MRGHAVGRIRSSACRPGYGRRGRPVVVAVRGAIRVRSNEKSAIHEAALRLAGEMVARNGIEIDRIISIVCSLTEDLTVANPATALRLDRFGEVPLFCVQEAAVEGQMARLVRMLMTYDATRPERPQPVYLNGAERLRPDLSVGPDRSVGPDLGRD